MRRRLQNKKEMEDTTTRRKILWVGVGSAVQSWKSVVMGFGVRDATT